MEIEGTRSRFSWVVWSGQQAGRAPTTKVGLPPRDVHAFPGTGSGIVGHGIAQAVPAVGAGADVVVAVLQVRQRAHNVVAGFELGGRQESTCLLRELGCGEERGEWGLARVLCAPGAKDGSYSEIPILDSTSAVHAAKTTSLSCGNHGNLPSTANTLS